VECIDYRTQCEYPSVDPLFPKNSVRTAISNKGSIGRIRSLHATTSLDSKEYNLQKKASALEDVLRAASISLAESHIHSCVEVYVRMSRSLEKRGCLNSKMHIAIGAVYYTLKLSMNPTIPELCTMFGCRKRKAMLAIKRFRFLCADIPEMGWVFENESGKTNLYRYGSLANLSWTDIRRVEEDMKSRGESLIENDKLMNAIRRLQHSPSSEFSNIARAK